MSIYKGNTLISRIKTGGGIYGTALANQVLTGYTVGTDNGLIDGSMANKTGTLQAAVPENPEADTSIRVAIPASGYYDTTSKLYFFVGDLLSANIKAGKNILGVQGSSSVLDTSDATVPDGSWLLAPVTAYKNGSKITGTMPDKRTTGIDTNRTEGIVEFKYPDPTYGDNAFLRFKADTAGYIDQNTIIRTLINNLSPANIKAGAKVGKYPLNEAGCYITGTFTSDANAVAGDMIASKTAYVNGSKITGTIPVKGGEEYAGWVRASYGEAAATTGRVHLKIPSGVYRPGAGNYDAGANFGVFYDDANFVPANIKSGVNVMGQIGSYVGGKYSVGDTIAPSSLQTPPYESYSVARTLTSYMPPKAVQDATYEYRLSGTTLTKHNLITEALVWTVTMPRAYSLMGINIPAGRLLFGVGGGGSDGYAMWVNSSTGALGSEVKLWTYAGTSQNITSLCAGDSGSMIYVLYDASYGWYYVYKTTFAGAGLGTTIVSNTAESMSVSGIHGTQYMIARSGYYINVLGTYTNSNTIPASYMTIFHDPTDTSKFYLISNAYEQSTTLTIYTVSYTALSSWSSNSKSITKTSTSEQHQAFAHSGRLILFLSYYFYSSSIRFATLKGGVLVAPIALYNYGFGYGSFRFWGNGFAIVIQNGNLYKEWELDKYKILS